MANLRVDLLNDTYRLHVRHQCGGGSFSKADIVRRAAIDRVWDIAAIPCDLWQRLPLEAVVATSNDHRRGTRICGVDCSSFPTVKLSLASSQKSIQNRLSAPSSS